MHHIVQRWPVYKSLTTTEIIDNSIYEMDIIKSSHYHPNSSRIAIKSLGELFNKATDRVSCFCRREICSCKYEIIRAQYTFVIVDDEDGGSICYDEHEHENTMQMKIKLIKFTIGREINYFDIGVIDCPMYHEHCDDGTCWVFDYNEDAVNCHALFRRLYMQNNTIKYLLALNINVIADIKTLILRAFMRL